MSEELVETAVGTPAQRTPRSRFRVVTVYVFTAAVVGPWTARFLVFVLLANIRPPLAIGLALWLFVMSAACVYSVRRAMRAIHRKATLHDARKCIAPALAGFALMTIPSLLLDVGLASNAGSDSPGSLAVLALLFNLGAICVQATVTVRGFETLDPEGPTVRLESILVPIGDLLLLIGFVLFLVWAL